MATQSLKGGSNSGIRWNPTSLVWEQSVNGTLWYEVGDVKYYKGSFSGAGPHTLLGINGLEWVANEIATGLSEILVVGHVASAGTDKIISLRVNVNWHSETSGTPAVTIIGDVLNEVFTYVSAGTMAVDVTGEANAGGGILRISVTGIAGQTTVWSARMSTTKFVE